MHPQPNPVTQYEQEQIAALHDRVSKAKQGPSAHTVTDRVTDLRVELATKIAERGMNLRELFNKCDKDGDGTYVSCRDGCDRQPRSSPAITQVVHRTAFRTTSTVPHSGSWAWVGLALIWTC